MTKILIKVEKNGFIQSLKKLQGSQMHTWTNFNMVIMVFTFINFILKIILKYLFFTNALKLLLFLSYFLQINCFKKTFGNPVRNFFNVVPHC